MIPTRWQTLARWQRSLSAEDEFDLLREEALEQARRRPPRPHRMVLVLVPHIAARFSDPSGRSFSAESRMTPDEIAHCRRRFQDFMELVFVYTGGALQVEATEVVVEEPVTRMSRVGFGRYWLSAHDALRGRESPVPRDTLDGLGVYYKMPVGVTPALHGGAVGRDHGVRGTAFWTLWITDWSEPHGPLGPTAIASLHEWLHNVSFHAHRVMDDAAVPDCHAGEEYGYWDTDGGYRQWMAWNRDLMLRFIPRGFWYRLSTRGPLLPSERIPWLLPWVRAWRRLIQGYGRGPRRARRGGSPIHWSEVGDDWMIRLPRLNEADLRRLTGLPSLRVGLHQSAPNQHVVWSLDPGGPVDSPIWDGDPLRAPPRLDNVLAFGRAPGPPQEGDPEAFRRAPLESLAWIRSPNARPDERDLVLIRPDAAGWLLPRLRSVGRRAQDSLTGYLSRRDPGEGQRINAIVAAFDFGPNPPADEVAALVG